MMSNAGPPQGTLLLPLPFYKVITVLHLFIFKSIFHFLYVLVLINYTYRAMQLIILSM